MNKKLDLSFLNGKHVITDIPNNFVITWDYKLTFKFYNATTGELVRSVRGYPGGNQTRFSGPKSAEIWILKYLERDDNHYEISHEVMTWPED